VVRAEPCFQAHFVSPQSLHFIPTFTLDIDQGTLLVSEIEVEGGGDEERLKIGKH